MKHQTCCFTGHRQIPPHETGRIQKSLADEIEKLIRQGVKYFGAGGALGFDTIAALAVLKLKRRFPHIIVRVIQNRGDPERPFRPGLRHRPCRAEARLRPLSCPERKVHPVSSTVLNHPDYKLILVLPCKNQTKDWGAKNKKVYESILKKADKTIYISEYYTAGCMHKRNRHLIDNSGICLCYYAGNSGGTAYTVSYAKQKNLTIINLA